MLFIVLQIRGIFIILQLLSRVSQIDNVLPRKVDIKESPLLMLFCGIFCAIQNAQSNRVICPANTVENNNTYFKVCRYYWSGLVHASGYLLLCSFVLSMKRIMSEENFPSSCGLRIFTMRLWFIYGYLAWKLIHIRYLFRDINRVNWIIQLKIKSYITCALCTDLKQGNVLCVVSIRFSSGLTILMALENYLWGTCFPLEYDFCSFLGYLSPWN